MKKLLFVLLLCVVAISSCDELEKKKVSHSSVDVGKLHLDNHVSLRVTEFTYKGHEFIWFKNEGGKYANSGIVHDPDCKCNNTD